MYKEMEAPCPCQNCGEWFDLNDGYRSDKWFPNTVICEECHNLEEKEIEVDDEEQESVNNLEDAVFIVNENISYLNQLKRPHHCYFSVNPNCLLCSGDIMEPVKSIVEDFNRKLICDKDKFFNDLNSKFELLNSQFPLSEKYILVQYVNADTGDIEYVLREKGAILKLIVIVPFTENSSNPF